MDNAPANSEDKYVVTHNNVQEVVSVQRVVGGTSTPVVIDGANPEYHRFLERIAGQMPPVGLTYEQLKPGFASFAGEQEVIDYCISTASVLFVRDKALSTGETFTLSHSWIVHSKTSVERRDIQFHELVGAVPATEAEADDEVAQLGVQPLGKFVTHEMLQSLNEELSQPDSKIRMISSWPVEKTFVYVDISNFSTHPVGHQVAIINALIQLTDDDAAWKTNVARESRSHREASLCIGDGYIFVFDAAHFAALFAAQLAYMIEHAIAAQMLVPFHFRIGVHTGEVYRFWDRMDATSGRWNYIGTGITDARRVLEAIGAEQDDVVFVSAETRQRIFNAVHSFSPYQASNYCQNRGMRTDKHKVMRRVYEVNHTKWVRELV